MYPIGLTIVPAALALSGAVLFGLGFNTFIKYRNELDVCNVNKNNLDALLGRYGIGYELDLGAKKQLWEMEALQQELKITSIPPTKQ